MTAAGPFGDARMRLPREPYPGLRPFLDFEAALLFGRERQCREVIERLRQRQFVAVLGGSGSGKSSMVHASVVPELRSFGIPGAGDLWLPLTCTPGTAAGDGTGRHSPVMRLARRFAGLLKGRGSDARDLERVHDIAKVFRQDAGFARLLDTYGAELHVPPGPDPLDARVLFVLDQFEEVFHPTNRGSADAQLYVERVLDHFFDPHPHCYVALTMRSEYLNECAAYLELPDAINSASYLVRRMDDEELRQVIVGPAQRFLRLMARSREPSLLTAPNLPDEVRFDPAVVERVLRDTRAITQDPDHLPLLQHLLARLWEAALEREELDMPVPSCILEVDLVRAVQAGTGTAPGDEVQLDERINTLRSCVENWPETVYQWHDAAGRAQLDALFSRLGSWDPNTGHYVQQRLAVEEGARLLGDGGTVADLRRLLAEGFLGSVDYLFWDDEDPARVTVKVSHESFIRGWSRFRALVDARVERFDEFVGVLNQCSAWLSANRNDDFLLAGSGLRRLAESGFADSLRREGDRAEWRRLLALDRDGARLMRDEAALDQFVALSQQREAEHVARQRRARRTAVLLLVSTVMFVLLPTALYSAIVQGPTMSRTERLFDAGNRANRATLGVGSQRLGDAAATLDSLLRAAELVESARRGEGSWRTLISQRALETLGTWPFLREQRDFLARVFNQAEPPVNGTLRQVITGSIWRADGRAVGDALAPPEARANAMCTAAAAGQAAERGRLFVAAQRHPSDVRPLRALFLPARPSLDRALEVFGATVDPVTGSCLLGAPIVSTPEALDSKLVFDASLRYFFYTSEGSSTAVPSVIVQEVDMAQEQDGPFRLLTRQTITVLSDPEAVRAVTQAAGESRIASLPTWRVVGGYRVRVGSGFWRMAVTQAQTVDLPSNPAQLRRLTVAPPGSACLALAQTFVAMPGFQTSAFESASHCFMVARGWPSALEGDDRPKPTHEEFRIAVHERPTAGMLEQAAQSPPAPVAALVPFTRLERAAGARAEDADWHVAESGDLAGWLLLELRDRSGASRFMGAPWSTCALWRQGRELRAMNPAPLRTQDGAPSACAAK